MICSSKSSCTVRDSLNPTVFTLAMLSATTDWRVIAEMTPEIAV